MSNALKTIKRILKNDADSKENAILTVINNLTEEDKKDLSKIFDTCLKSNLSKALYQIINKEHYKPTPTQINECLFKRFENVSMHYFRDQLFDLQSYDQNSFLSNIIKFNQNKTLEMILNREFPDLKQLSSKTKKNILLIALVNDNAEAFKLLINKNIIDKSQDVIQYSLEQATLHRSKNIFTYIINELPVKMNKEQQVNLALNSFDYSDTFFFDQLLKSNNLTEIKKWLSSNTNITNNMLESDLKDDMNKHIQHLKNKKTNSI